MAEVSGVQRTCPVCGREAKKDPSKRTGYHPKYCSVLCQRRANSRRQRGVDVKDLPVRLCLICGREVVGRINKTCCSRDCSLVLFKQNRRKKTAKRRVGRMCLMCLGPLEGAMQKKFCSRSCQTKAVRERDLEKVRARGRAHYTRHAEQLRERSQRYRKEYPEKARKTKQKCMQANQKDTEVSRFLSLLAKLQQEPNHD